MKKSMEKHHIKLSAESLLISIYESCQSILTWEHCLLGDQFHCFLENHDNQDDVETNPFLIKSIFHELLHQIWLVLQGTNPFLMNNFKKYSLWISPWCYSVKYFLLIPVFMKFFSNTSDTTLGVSSWKWINPFLLELNFHLLKPIS